MKKTLYILAFVVLLASCKADRKDLIEGEWHAVKLDNPQMDSTIRDQEAFVDSFGKGTDAAANKELYGVENVDSMRVILKQQLAEYKEMQQHAVKNTWFHFRKDGLALMNFSGQNDSANWYFDDEGALMLDEMKLKGYGNKLKMEIVTLSEDSLRLRFTEDGLTSTVSFRPGKK